VPHSKRANERFRSRMSSYRVTHKKRWCRWEGGDVRPEKSVTYHTRYWKKESYMSAKPRRGTIGGRGSSALKSEKNARPGCDPPCEQAVGGGYRGENHSPVFSVLRRGLPVCGKNRHILDWFQGKASLGGTWKREGVGNALKVNGPLGPLGREFSRKKSGSLDSGPRYVKLKKVSTVRGVAVKKKNASGGEGGNKTSNRSSLWVRS